MDKQYSFDDYCRIIARLRGNEGCPWDREQTHDSLKTCLINESAEVLAAIDIYNETGDSENLCEELGDLLLQVVLHTQIASEEGLFSMEDVIQRAGEKMIRRHPHVFASENAGTSAEVLVKWDDIKKMEKQGKSIETEEIQKRALTKAKAEMAQYLL